MYALEMCVICVSEITYVCMCLCVCECMCMCVGLYTTKNVVESKLFLSFFSLYNSPLSLSLSIYIYIYIYIYDV